MEDLQQQIDILNKKVATLERNAIQLEIDPTISLYLKKPIDERIVTYPTQTYATIAPTTPTVPSSVPLGSIWIVDTGSTITNALYAYNGTIWVQIK